MSLESPFYPISDESLEAGERVLEREITATQSIDRLFLDTEKYYEHLGVEGEAELLRLKRFAWLANGSTLGINAHTAYAFYKGEITGLAVAGTLIGKAPYPSDAIQEGISKIFTDKATDYLKGVGRGGEGTNPVPPGAASLQERRQQEAAQYFIEDCQEAPDQFSDRYRQLKKHIERLTEQLPLHEAVMARAGFWLVLRESLEPTIQYDTGPILTHPLVQHVEPQPQQQPSFAPLEDLHPELQALDLETERGFVSINDAIHKLMAEARHRVATMHPTNNPGEIREHQKDLQDALRSYAKKHLCLDETALLSFQGTFFYFTNKGEGAEIAYADTKKSLSLTGTFERIVIHKAPTLKSLKRYNPAGITDQDLVYEQLAPHIRLTEAALIDSRDGSITPIQGKVDIPLTYPSLHTEAFLTHDKPEGE